MSINIKAIESRIGDAVHSVLDGIETAEPEIEHGAEAALLAAGAPATLAAAIGNALTELLNHFRGQAPAPVLTPVSGIPTSEAPTPQPAAIQPVAANQLSS